MTLKKISTGIFVLVVLAVAGLVLTGTIVKAEEGGFGVSFKLSESGFFSLLSLLTEKVETEVQVGAQPGPDSYAPYRGLNDVRTYSQRQTMITATNTPCVVRSPLHATSTLVRSEIRFELASTAATTFNVGRAPSNDTNATTTANTFFEGSVAANLKATYFVGATTTADATVGDVNTIFAPGDWYVLTLAGIQTAGEDFGGALTSGVCNVTFEEIY